MTQVIPLIPICPNCGSRTNVVRMATSLTPFERPERDDLEEAHFYCISCAHDFVPGAQEDA